MSGGAGWRERGEASLPATRDAGALDAAGAMTDKSPSSSREVT
jgi:hypothetical protein